MTYCCFVSRGSHSKAMLRLSMCVVIVVWPGVLVRRFFRWIVGVGNKENSVSGSNVISLSLSSLLIK